MFKIRASKFRHVFCDQPKPEVRFGTGFVAGPMVLLLIYLRMSISPLTLPPISLTLSTHSLGMLDRLSFIDRDGGSAVH